MPLDILCFGNSLTAGWWAGTEFHPYAINLKEQLLSSEAPGCKSVIIEVEGEPGDLVNSPPGRFLTRMQMRCEKVAYDWVIVLGGTNDLGWGRSWESIYEGLQSTWNLALNSGNQDKTHVLALTVPECAHQTKSLVQRRDQLNASIMAHEQERFHTFDLKTAIPYHSMPEERRKRIWDDGLHFTDEGYDLMGEVIAERLLELMAEKTNDSKA